MAPREIIKIDASSDPLRYLVKFNFYKDDRNFWAVANELLDDVLCGDRKRDTLGYGIIFLDRHSVYAFGSMESAKIKRLIIMRQCKKCQKFFRFIQLHERKEHELGKKKNELKVKFNDTPQIHIYNQTEIWTYLNGVWCGWREKIKCHKFNVIFLNKWKNLKIEKPITINLHSLELKAKKRIFCRILPFFRCRNCAEISNANFVEICHIIYFAHKFMSLYVCVKSAYCRAHVFRTMKYRNRTNVQNYVNDSINFYLLKSEKNWIFFSSQILIVCLSSKTVFYRTNRFVWPFFGSKVDLKATS